MKWSDLLLEGDHAITLEEEVEGGIRFSLTAHETFFIFEKVKIGRKGSKMHQNNASHDKFGWILKDLNI